eukprot:scaffold42176_cov854-Skeletonema_marinoi.AAC.1
MQCNDSKLGIPFVRRQYPILLAYYLTINRSQGQTLDVVGVEPPTSVFMHGHVYVGYGRTGDPKGLHIYANQDKFDCKRLNVLADTWSVLVVSNAVN